MGMYEYGFVGERECAALILSLDAHNEEHFALIKAMAKKQATKQTAKQTNKRQRAYDSHKEACWSFPKWVARRRAGGR